MAFIVETGTGITNANSLASVAFANAYHADRGNAVWATFGLERKQANLIKATDYFVGIYGQSLLGDLVSSAQALPFPRTVNYVNVGNPIRIQEAIAELAFVADSMSLYPANNVRTKKRVKIGPLEVEYDGNAPQAAKFVAVVLKLATWLKAGSLNTSMARLQRV